MSAAAAVQETPAGLRVILSLPAEAICGGSGRSSGPTRLAEFSHSGPGQPLPEHGRRQPHDPQTTSDPAGQGQDPNAGGGAEDRGRQWVALTSRSTPPEPTPLVFTTPSLRLQLRGTTATTACCWGDRWASPTGLWQTRVSWRSWMGW